MSQQTHPFIDQIYAHCNDMNKSIFIRKKNELKFKGISLADLYLLEETPDEVEVFVGKEEDLPEYEYLGTSGIANRKSIRDHQNVPSMFWLVDLTNPDLVDYVERYKYSTSHLCILGLVYKDKESALIKARYILSLLGVQTT